MVKKLPGAKAASEQTPRCIAHLRSKHVEMEAVPFFPSGPFYEPSDIAIYQIGLSYLSQKGRAKTESNHITPLSLEFPVLREGLDWTSVLVFHRFLHGYNQEVEHLSLHVPSDVNFEAVRTPTEELITCPVCENESGIFQFLAVFAFDPDVEDDPDFDCGLQDAFEEMVLVGKCDHCDESSFLYAHTPYSSGNP